MSNPAGVTVGVTGHRSQALAGADLALLSSRISMVLALAGGAQGGETLVLISALAEGADRMAARAALKLGWRLRCPLPFSRSEYEKDFASRESLEEFRALLARAEKVWTAGRGENKKDRNAGYSAANQAMLDGSGLLLAVWDGRPARGEGGTAQVVAQALDRGLTVVRVDAAPPHQATLLHSGPGEPPLFLAGLERGRADGIGES